MSVTVDVNPTGINQYTGGTGKGNMRAGNTHVHKEKEDVNVTKAMKVAQVEAARQGLAGHVKFVNTLGTFDVGGQRFDTAGKYTSMTGNITLAKDVITGINEVKLQGVVAHECGHDIYNSAWNNSTYEETRILNNGTPQLIKDDGVSEYSKAYWREHAEGGIHSALAMNETFAEIHKAVSMTTRSGGTVQQGLTRWKIAPSWQKLYKDVLKKAGR